MAVYNIVVVGANFAGAGAAHYLLRHTIPALEAQNNQSTTYKVTLISPSTHFFYKIAAPRTVVKPAAIPIEKIFLSLKDGFKQYSPEKFTLVLGSATALDEQRRTVTVEPLAPASTTSVSYDSLVIATGTTSTSALWTLHGSHEASIKEFKEVHQLLPKASTVLIAGGGPAGVETAGELGTYFPNVSSTILSGNERLLHRLRPAIGADAQTKLANLGVKTIHNVKVTSVARTEAGQTTVQLSDQTTQTVDVYIDATGGRPNSGWLPSSWLNQGGYVETDRETMRVNAAKGVYAVGDVASYSLGGILDVLDAVRPLASSVLVDLSEGKHSGAQGPKQIPFVQRTIKETQFVPIGPKGGVGVAFGWRVPSFMVWLAKARTYFVEKAPGAVEGKDFLKA